MKVTNINITKFSDYRSFLLAHSQEKQLSTPTWSYGVWAKQLGLKSTSSITKVINGKRHPGDNISRSLTKYFKFSKKETQYFKDLVRLKKIKDDPRLKVLLLKKIGKVNPDGEESVIDLDTFKIVSKWEHFAIREMSRLKNFKLDINYISKRLLFKTKKSEVKNCIENLVKTGLIEINNKKVKLLIKNPHTSNELTSEAIKQYHESMLENAKFALRNIGVQEREFQSETISFNKEKLPEAKELIRDFKEKFARLMDSDKGDEVYQMQMQFFPITKSVEITNEK